MDLVKYTVQIVITTYYSLKAVSLEQLWIWECWVESTFQGPGGGEEPPNAWIQLTGQLVVTSSQ